MTRERAIEVLKAWDLNWSDEFTANEFEQAFAMAISALSDYDKMQEISLDLAFENDELINKSRWIPVSEMLPKEDGQYLITVKYKHVEGYDDIYAEHGEWTDGRWDMFCFGHCGEVENIIAWMPLPEPYKPERGETR